MMAALLALGLLALFAGPASAMKYSLSIAHPEGGTIGSLPSAGGIATDSAGNVYIVERGLVGETSKVEKFNSSGKYLMKITGISAPATDVDVDSAGNIWVLSPWELAKFSSAGSLLKKVSLFEQSIATATKPSGNVIGLGLWSGYEFDTNGTLKNFMSGPNFNEHATDIDVDSAGRMWAGDTAGGTFVRSYDASGSYLTSWSPPGYVAGVAGDNSGNVWVAEPGFCRVRKYTSTGKFLEGFGECGTGTGKFQYEKMPHERPGIGYGPGGVVWVSNGTEVQKWIP
jgi:sugar lactone lactonase YvrE